MFAVIPTGMTKGDCGHIWETEPTGYESEPISNCPICAQIKAAEDKRGQEVLDLAGKVMRYPKSYEIETRWAAFVKAYEGKFK